jgi:hypothetical protein
MKWVFCIALTVLAVAFINVQVVKNDIAALSSQLELLQKRRIENVPDYVDARLADDRLQRDLDAARKHLSAAGSVVLLAAAALLIVGLYFLGGKVAQTLASYARPAVAMPAAPDIKDPSSPNYDPVAAARMRQQAQAVTPAMKVWTAKD